jgi:hypothetical protein
MTTSQELLLSSITQYYEKNPEYKGVLEKVIHGEYKISLRVIDWFITHYAKTKNVLFWIDTQKHALIENPTEFHAGLKKFHLYLEYRAQLKSYTKMFFDPFRRHERISFLISKKPMKVMETTIGQLNFFRWIFQNHILSYIEKYQEQIEDEMAKFQSSKKDKQETATPEKKKSVSRSIGKNMNNTCLESQCFLRFD